MSDPTRYQEDYYTRTAAAYDTQHLGDPEHQRALAVVSGAVRSLGARSVLDVGTGTGRALQFLGTRHEGLRLHGVDPVAALLARAERDHGIDPALLSVASGDALPFADASFDVVASFGVLHHVKEPGRVVEEMMRVARRAVFISDDNRFGAGPRPARVAKLLLAKSGAWPLFYRAKTRGKGYRISEDDGLSYSYSVYDDLHRFESWADAVQLLATDVRTPAGTWLHPLLTSPHVLLCATRPERAG